VRSAVDVLKGSGRVSDGRDIAIVPGDELSTLPALIIAPSDPVRIGAANRALERAGIPWRFGAQRRGDVTVTAVRDSAIGDSTQAAFVDISATLRYQLVPQAGADADTLARVGQEPWIVAGPRYAIVASPMDPAATTFPVRAAFVPWLATVLTERLVGEPGGVLAATPGERIRRPRWADALEGAGGARITLADDLEAPARAGTYFFDRSGRRVGALVVNPEPRESILDRASASEIARHIRARQVLPVSDRAQFSSLSFRSAGRSSIAEPLLIAALILLGLEAYFVGARRRMVA
jgi:hypothetical protein